MGRIVKTFASESKTLSNRWLVKIVLEPRASSLIARASSTATFTPSEQLAFPESLREPRVVVCTITRLVTAKMRLCRGVMTPARSMTYCSPACYPVFHAKLRVFHARPLLSGRIRRVRFENVATRWINERIISVRSSDCWPITRTLLGSSGLTSLRLSTTVEIRACGAFLQARTTTRGVVGSLAFLEGPSYGPGRWMIFVRILLTEPRLRTWRFIRRVAM